MWKKLFKKKHSYVKKGKTISLQTWTGPEGSRRLRLSDFKTVGTCVSPTHWPPSPPGNIPGIPSVRS